MRISSLLEIILKGIFSSPADRWRNSRFKWLPFFLNLSGERDGFLSRLHRHVPVATRRELRASLFLGDHIFDEELVSQVGDRLQRNVSLKSNTIMLDTLVKGQGPRTRAPPQPKWPTPALPPTVSNKKPKQNPQPSGRSRGNKGKGHFSGQSA